MPTHEEIRRTIQLLIEEKTRESLPPAIRRREIRESADISVLELAETIHVTRQSLYRWERGAEPSGENRQAYSEALEAITSMTPQVKSSRSS